MNETKKKGLGRGLSALFGETKNQAVNKTSNTSQKLAAVSDLCRNQYQPRINFDQNKVGEIISSFNKLAIAMLKIEEAKSIFLNKEILKTESATLKIIF